MASDTAVFYLRNHPLDAARVLELAKSDELAVFIDALDGDDQALLLTHLLSQTSAAYLSQIHPKAAADIVGQLRTPVAARILGALPQVTRRDVLDALPLEKRTNIRHLLRYPEDSVGSLMLSNTLVCRVDATVRRAKQLVRRLSHIEVAIMVVVDDAMIPVGLISVSKLLRVRERELVKDHMRFVPSRLRAHAEVRTVLTMPAWETEEYLPVVESDDRYVGLLAKANLHGHALAARTSASQSDDFTTTAIDLADLVWNPVAGILARLSTVKLEDHNE